MKNVVKFIVFVMYTIAIFLIRDFKLLGLLFVLNCVIAIWLKINVKNMIYYLKIILPFVLFTVVMNILLADWQEGILIGVRILICYFATYLYARTVSTLQLANTIEKIGSPLKLFKINTKNIGIMVSISICMIPVLKNEIQTLIQTMKSRGKTLKLSNIMIIMKPMLISILQKTNEMEKKLISVGVRKVVKKKILVLTFRNN